MNTKNNKEVWGLVAEEQGNGGQRIENYYLAEGMPGRSDVTASEEELDQLARVIRIDGDSG